MAELNNRTFSECPECHSPITSVDEQFNELDLPVGLATPVICKNCAHVVQCWHYSSGRYLLQKVDYDWLHMDCFKPVDHETIRDVQEKQHHDNGHWG